MVSALPPDASLRGPARDERRLRPADADGSEIEGAPEDGSEEAVDPARPHVAPAPVAVVADEAGVEEGDEAAPEGIAALLAPLLRPVRTSRPGTMPAGKMLVVTVATLVLALGLCAGALDRKAAGRRPNSEARRGIADVVAAVASAIGLDRPEEALSAAVDPALSRTRGRGDQRSSELADAARALNGADVDAIRAGAGAGPVNAQPTVPAAPQTGSSSAEDRTPRLRAPTPDRPLRLWLGGDSISQELGLGLSRLAGETRLFEVMRDARPSTGLTRPDYFNWPEHLTRDIAPVAGGGVDPEIVVLMFGGNDDQNMPGWAGQPPASAGTVGWLDQYRRRVGDTMDMLKSPRDDRLVIWPGIPVSPPGTLPHVAAINAVYASEAARRPWVRYFDSSAFLSDPFGRYAPSLANADGRVREMRAGDGIHLSAAGGLRLAQALYARLAMLVDLSAAPLSPDPAQVAPPSVMERSTVEIVGG